MIAAQRSCDKHVIAMFLHAASVIFEPHATEGFLLPHQFIYIAYFLCFAGMAVSIFFIILYGHLFGVEKTAYWLVSLVVSLLGSFLLIEPIKVECSVFVM